jgi:hypothetical protein
LRRKYQIILGSCYRSPSNNPNENIDLHQSLSLAADLRYKYVACLLAGDFNLNIDWSNDTPMPKDQLTNQFLSKCIDFFATSVG